MAVVTPGREAPAPVYSAFNPNTQVSGSTPGSEPARVLRESWRGNPDSKDLAAGITGMPTNMGQEVLPHVVTFQGIISSAARVYRPSDEAIKDSFENSRFMRNDCAVMECLEQRQRSTALLDWRLEADDKADESQTWLCEQLTAIIERIPRFMQYREYLLGGALWAGRTAVKHRYRWQRVRGRQRVVVDKWQPVNGDKLVFRYDDGTGENDPDQIGLRVGAGFTTGAGLAQQWDENRRAKVEPTDYGLAYFLDPWERDLLAIHKHMVEDGEYEDPRSAGKIHGVGIRSRIYWIWYQKQEALAWLMEFLERSAFGIEIWYYPYGNAEAEKKTRLAAEQRIGEGRNIIMVPRPLGEESMAYGVDRIEPGMQGADVLKDILTNYFGHLIKRYILGQTLTTEAESTGLGSNLASVHLDTYLQIVKYDSVNLQETITTDLVEPLKRMNFPKFADVPIHFKIDTESPDVEGKLAAWRQAYDMGCKLPAREVMDLIGSKDVEEGEDALQSPEHLQAAQQMEMAEKQQAAEEQRLQMEQQNQDWTQAQSEEENARKVASELGLPVQGEQPAGQQPVPNEPPLEYDAKTGEPIHENADRFRMQAEQYAKFEESKISRVGKGTAEGGQFGSGAGDSSGIDRSWRDVKPQEESAEGQKDLFGGETAKAPKAKQPKSEKRKAVSRVKFDRGNIDSVINAALRLDLEEPVYIAAGHGGFGISDRKPPEGQSYYAVSSVGEVTLHEWDFQAQTEKRTVKRTPKAKPEYRQEEMFGGSKKGDLAGQTSMFDEEDIWEQEITSEEMASLRAYTSAAGFGDNDYWKMNEALRSHDPSMEEETKRDVRLLDTALTKLPKSPGVSNRIVSFETREQWQAFMDQHESGAIVQYPHFASSSRGGWYGNEHGPSGQVNFVIEGKTGRDLSAISAFGDKETEILFPRNTSFRVDKVRLNVGQNGASYMWLTEVSKADQSSSSTTLPTQKTLFRLSETAICEQFMKAYYHADGPERIDQALASGLDADLLVVQDGELRQVYCRKGAYSDGGPIPHEHYARVKPAAGQGAFKFNEDDHPRAVDGKFSEKEEQGTGETGDSTGDSTGDIPGQPEEAPEKPTAPPPPVNEPSDEEKDKYAEYRKSMEGSGIEPRPINDWLENYRQVQERKKGKEEPQPPVEKGLKTESAEPPAASTPRSQAEDLFQKNKDEEYAFARKSKVRNAGEDLLGSARHKRNEWRGLDQAEKDGKAEELVTRAHLLKNEPHNLVSLAEKNPLTALAMHLGLLKMPAKPGYYKVREATDEETKKKDREDYLSAYRYIKAAAEKIAEDEVDGRLALEALQLEVRALITGLRNDDRFNNTANSLVSMSNSLVGWTGGGQRAKSGPKASLNQFAEAVKDKYGDIPEDNDGKEKYYQQVTSHAQDMIEGASLNKTFGRAGEGRGATAFNPADHYVKHATRQGGPDIGVSTAKQGKSYMLDKFKMRGLQHGNSVTDDEREHHVVKATEAFADLADILGIPEEYVSWKGTLGIAFGARGHGTASAHYEPDTKVINLTRKSGVGSLAHEWGHFMDNELGRAREVPRTKRHGSFMSNDSRQTDDPLNKAYWTLHDTWVKSGFHVRLRDNLDRLGVSAKKKEYYTSNIEMFARTFERYVQGKLDDDGRANTYLAGSMGDNVWPTDDEMKSIAPAFDAIFGVLSEGIKKGKYSLRELGDKVVLNVSSSINAPADTAS